MKLPEGQYVIAFTGVDQGVLLCLNLDAMQSKVRDLFPDHYNLLDPDDWTLSHTDDQPYYFNYEYEDERGSSRVRIYRVMGLTT